MLEKKILITGGAGFIGSNIAERLITDGFEIHIVDDLSSGFKSNLPKQAVFHELSITSADIHDLFEKMQFDVLIHHAAQMDVRKSVKDPLFDADINISGTLNLLEAGRKNNLEKVIFASTGGAIYGEPEYIPQDEEHPTEPLSPYGIAKLTAEKYLKFYHELHGINVTNLRYANVYGPRQNPHGDAGVIAIFIQKFLDQERPIIFGSGDQTRDYVYVGDVVEANRQAIDLDGFQTINIGTRTETSVNELFTYLSEIFESNLQPDYKSGKKGEQLRSVLDNTKAKQLLNWRPEIDIKNGLKNTVKWFAEQDA